MVEIACTYVVAPPKAMRVPLLFSNDPISFFGGVDAAEGRVVDRRHGNFGRVMTGKAFAFPFGKGSSGAGLVLMEMERLGTAPAAIINIRTDPVILTGPLVCRHFYGKSIPVVNVSEADYGKLAGMSAVALTAGGTALVAISG